MMFDIARGHLRCHSCPSYNVPPLRGPYALYHPPSVASPYNAPLHTMLGIPRPTRVWNLTCSWWRLPSDPPMRRGESLSLTIRLPNEQPIEVPEAVVR